MVRRIAPVLLMACLLGMALTSNRAAWASGESESSGGSSSQISDGSNSGDEGPLLGTPKISIEIDGSATIVPGGLESPPHHTAVRIVVENVGAEHEVRISLTGGGGGCENPGNRWGIFTCAAA